MELDTQNELYVRKTMNKYYNTLLNMWKEIEGISKNDDSRNNEFNVLSKNELLELLLNNEGIYGYTEKLLDWISEIYEIEFD